MGLNGIKYVSVEWTESAQDKYQWRILKKSVMNFRVKRKMANFM